MSEDIDNDPDALQFPDEEEYWNYTNGSMPEIGHSLYIGEDRWSNFHSKETTKAGPFLLSYTIVRSDEGRRVCIRLGRFSHS